MLAFAANSQRPEFFMRDLIRQIAEEVIAEQDDPQEVAGDQFAELGENACPIDPHGHLFFAPKCASVPRCVHCKEPAPWF